MRAAQPAFLMPFMLLAMLSGATLGTAKIVTTLYAMEMGANPLQIGLISALESLGMVCLTLPAGFWVARLGVRRTYLGASLGPALLHLAILLWPGWWWLAAMRLLVGACVPFRVVAMNSLFLQRLPSLGMGKAGWFRGSVMIGLGLLGPWLGNLAYETMGARWAFVLIALAFAGMAFYGVGFWRDAPAAVRDRPAVTRQQVVQTLREPVLAASCLIELLSSATASAFATFALVLCIEVLGWSAYQAALLLSVHGLVGILALFGLGRWVAGFSHARVYLGGWLLGSLALYLMARETGFAALLLATVLLSLASAVVHLANVARLAGLALDKARISGVFNLSQTAGMLGGALLGGLLSQWLGLQEMFLYWAAALGMLGVAICLGQRRRTQA